MADAVGWILYDAGCGVCSRAVPAWAASLAKAGLGTRPLQDPWVRGQLGLGEDELLRDIRLLLADGRHLAGADVYRFVFRRRWRTYPLYLLSVVPGLRQLVDLAYRTFARHRHDVSRACGLEPIARG